MESNQANNPMEQVGNIAPAIKAPPRAYTRPEVWLLPAALAIGIVMDRLFIQSFQGYAVSWLVYLAIYAVFNWKRVVNNPVSVFLFAASLLLGIYPFFYAQRQFSMLMILALPCLLMLLAQLASIDWRPGPLFKAMAVFFLGWFWYPFNAIKHCFGTIGSLLGKRAGVAKALLGVLALLALLCVIFPLLLQSDMVFGYYVNRVLSAFNIQSFILHAVIACVLAVLFYSFLWNTYFGRYALPEFTPGRTNDVVTTATAVGGLLAVYALFCAVQFAYLFAGAGLPDNMTYSQYAVTGFWQLIVVTAINLLIYAWCQRFAKQTVLITGLSVGLLAATLVMLVSAAIRLSLYIGAYGMTWLRLISFWFIIYLAVALVLCAVKLKLEKLPLTVAAAGAFIVWFLILGYASPDNIIARVNLAMLPAGQTISEKSAEDFRPLSTDALPALREYYERTGDNTAAQITKDIEDAR